MNEKTDAAAAVAKRPIPMGVLIGILVVIIAQAFLPRMLDLVSSVLIVGGSFYLGWKASAATRRGP